MINILFLRRVTVYCLPGEMGSCVSVHKDPESAVKFRMSFRSRNDIPSPLNDKSEMVNGADRTLADVPFKSQSSPARPVYKVRDYYGSKDAIFFDSQPWLDSDCEEDFLSVNGDFTPSRGSTPVHHSFSVGSPQVNKAPVVEENTLFPKPEPKPEPEPEPSPSPTDKRKRLSELFKESLRVEQYPDGDSTVGDDPAKSEEAEAESHVRQAKSKIGNPTTTPTPCLSGANSVSYSERAPSGAGDKSANNAQCCLPRLLSSHNFSEKNKKMSPVPTFG